MSDRSQAAEVPRGAGPPSLSVAAAGEPEIAEEQLAYANLLDAGMKLGLMVLVVTFAIYAAGALVPQVPLTDLPRYWSLPVKEYLAATGAPTGWGWMALLQRGDYLNFIGIALLASVTIACYLAILPIFVRRRDRAYALLAAAEVLVLVVAASGVLGAGGH